MPSCIRKKKNRAAPLRLGVWASWKPRRPQDSRPMLHRRMNSRGRARGHCECGEGDLTLFAIPKNFHGHFATIQRNAITSWTRLNPRPEIFLFGDEDGTAEIAGELGIRHFPEVARNEFNTPMIDDLFRRAEQHATSPLIGYINSDIVLTDEFSLAIG